MQTLGKLNQEKKMNPGESFYTADVAAKYDDVRKKDRYWDWEDEVLAKALALLNSGDYVVDCPFGTGRFLPLYKKYDFKVLGLDISDDMLFEADKKVKQLNLEDKVKLVKADLNEFKYMGEPLKALVSFRLLHLISPENVEDYVNSLAAMPSRYIFLQLFTVYDFSPLLIVKRLGQVFTMDNVSRRDKIVYFVRTVYSIQNKFIPNLRQYFKKKLSSIKNLEVEEGSFCDVSHFHSLKVIEGAFGKKGFIEKQRFELVDLVHVQNESATRATALLVLEKR